MERHEPNAEPLCVHQIMQFMSQQAAEHNFGYAAVTSQHLHHAVLDLVTICPRGNLCVLISEIIFVVLVC